VEVSPQRGVITPQEIYQSYELLPFSTVNASHVSDGTKAPTDRLECTDAMRQRQAVPNTGTWMKAARRRLIDTKAWNRPLTRLIVQQYRAVGCIDLRVVAKSLRCSLLEISDQVLGKLRQQLTRIGSDRSGEADFLRDREWSNLVQLRVIDPNCFMDTCTPLASVYDWAS